MCCCSCWPSTPLKEFREESRNEVLCSQGKTSSTGPQIVRWSQELILWAQFLYLLISRKALKSSMLTNVPCDYQKPSAKRYCMYSPFTKITYLLIFFTASGEQFLSVIWGAVYWAIVLILPQIKHHLQLSHCVFSFFFYSTAKHTLTKINGSNTQECPWWKSEKY